ncbi:histidinol-phosphatase (PHP family) [Breznakia sp. PF5-3]|uniref:histidinol-phosphatase n=1 Tax=unclassified Breznakia TaxID=2623764 RepID=UPI00240741CA|nr:MULTISPECIES: histidinol-phosphatase [unclassified Breznakia]MDF9825134.1 histidinol-phosphatase (PHP family) [Breznakia sp. PM6-1]MDF9836007.1 histidinol-phosphatase (PHP family) [Breznakia sp. PF5-3]MDF9838105.1 histidinol-phosphatase (PHP family) [Breznakia sp. PFB2-8]MDF9860065.1 histidinol-phosphatase (PHP family) [Breznakia sp. PH5-24]
MKTNYHTHTTRCNHACGSDEQFVLSAIRGGFKELGFSDHSPWNYSPSTYKGSHIRMRLEEFEDYYNSLSHLKEKYKDQISIKIGLEVEYFPEYMEWLRRFIKEKELDYIILGNHFHKSDENGPYYGHECDKDKWLRQYAIDAIEALETGLYAYLAHPDLFMRGRTKFDRLAKEVSYQICEACKEMDIPLEYNLAGAEVSDYMHVIQYPHPEFWKIAADVGNKVIIGCDAHNYKQLENEHYWNKALKHIEELGLERVETIKFLR